MHDTFNSFLSDLKVKGKQPKTISTYESVLQTIAHWMEETTGEAFHPEDVTPIDAAEYLRYLLERFKPATINKIFPSLSVLLWSNDKQIR